VATHALGRHLALAGFMGAGKSSKGSRLAERLHRPFVDLDQELERRTGKAIAELFAEAGESGFRAVEEETALELLGRGEPHVMALGGGAVLSGATRSTLAERALTVWLDVDLDVAWSRVEGTGRPLAADEQRFRALYEERAPIYATVADARVDEDSDDDELVLAAGGVHAHPGSLEQLGELVPGAGPVELVADAHVAGIHGMDAQLALGGRVVRLHELPSGEAAKQTQQLERLWRALSIGRDGVIVGLGGGCTTDVAGFAAATWMRGVPWVAVPTTLVGQVDAAIGGKTAIDLPGAKNLVGAFHWPKRVLADARLLETLPERERRNGLAEIVKTGLLAGEALWELSEPQQVRRCAAFKVALCLADPYDRDARAQLNLGHTFAHALEAAAGYELPHGEAVALGLLAALRLSANADGVEIVDEVLRPRPVPVDRDRAWAALARDKKSERGVPRVVLLEQPGRPRWGVELATREIRAALDELIAD
jgi:shikimate kinase/3-dehydroquinate synthase